jgi:transposase
MTLAELAERLDVHPNRIPQGPTHFLEGASGVSGGASPTDEAPVAEVKTPHAKLGELTLENDF